MNEKIQELIRHATKSYPNHIVNSDNQIILEQYEDAVDLEQFAKLIIKECTDICDQRVKDLGDLRRTHYDFTNKSVIAYGESTAEILSSDIKKHFGLPCENEEETNE